MIQKRGLWQALFFTTLPDKSAAAYQASAPVIRGERHQGAGDGIQADTCAAIALHATRRKLARVMDYRAPTPRADLARARISMNGLKLRRGYEC